MNGVETVRVPLPRVDRREVLRYAGCRRSTPDMEALLTDCLQETDGLFTGQVCALTLPVTGTEEGVWLGTLYVPSRLLAETVAGCSRAMVFAATVGHPIDRLIARYSRLSPARAVMLQALGTERVEALCDTFCATRRVSPGYGDIPLSLQADLFALLEPHRHIGVTLQQSLLMTPTKSVTAVTGIKD
ncbi:MAG: hypothetical protein E7541_00590 [Ruminococcaceae bacterium]|nr:hypothetical protein [Oscillospiraceae bacterium]